jgi:hypothetical protein
MTPVPGELDTRKSRRCSIKFLNELPSAITRAIVNEVHTAFIADGPVLCQTRKQSIKSLGCFWKNILFVVTRDYNSKNGSLLGHSS